ncbi:ABC transporter substrate-binding protein [Aminobacter aminovorans]|jgi:putative spermidine/putrescine transport system substrate-binding protein|uniref:ABC transporter substrate-binding protein n=1 Tax=Aminobacter TaxID=31988 RepID=UPI002857F719|nr:ABC transporter substrate-binding protein [Aminobacter aminovorans]MDR7223062.1 putative spermidine/putrescine transport system substrate-binding protein [Aminobacter aminovorans]
MKLTRREFAVGMTTAIASMTLPRLATAQSPLVVPTYGGLWAKFWEEKLLPGLTTATGIQPQLDVGLGKDFVAKIRAGGGRSPYSIFMGNENIAAVLRAEGFFEPFDLTKVPNAAKTFPQFVNKDAKGIRAIVSPIGLAYRTDLVKTAPTSWHDLWDNPEFKGKTGLYQIGNTGAVLFLRLVAELFGSGPDDFDTAFAKIKELLPFTQASWSGEVATALIRGDAIIAPVDWTEIMTLQDKGAPVAIVAPKEGVLAFEQSFNLVATGAEKDAAHAYLNYILDAKVQQDMAKAFYTSPSNSESSVDDAMKARTPIVGPRMTEIKSYDWDSYVDKAADIADRWNREMA